MSETDVMRAIMIEATKRGHRLMRNNVGFATYRDEDGNVTGKVKYGVGGVGAGDLVGWTLRRIHDHAVLTDWNNGKLITSDATYPIPVFTMIETKTPTGKTAKKRLAEQNRKIDAVRAAGGIAGFCNSVEAYLRLIGED
jgi:hypothetical protein